MRFSGLVLKRTRVQPVLLALLALFAFVSSPNALCQGPGVGVEAGNARRAASESGCVDLTPGNSRGSKVGVRRSTQPAEPSSNLVPRLRVRWEGGKLGVSAEGVALAAVLREVACRTDMEVQGAETLQEEVHAEFSGLPLGEALRDLLAGVDYAVLGDLSSSQPLRRARLVIFRAHAQNVQTQARNALPVLVRAGERAKNSEAGAAPPPSGVQVDEDELIKQIMSPDPAAQERALNALAGIDAGRAVEALEAAIKNGEPAARLEALQLLDRFPQANTDIVFSALRTALGDSDMNMKLYAIQASVKRGGSEAIDLLDQAFSSPDANVRLMVVEGAAETKEGEPLLRHALLDPDEAVAVSASALLNQASSSIDQSSITTDRQSH